MQLEDHLFIDMITGRTVYDAVCPCGRKWMIDVRHGFPLFKVERVT